MRTRFENRFQSIALCIVLLISSTCLWGCSSSDDVIKGRWTIDVSGSIQTFNKEASLAMVPRIEDERLKEIADGLTVDFGASGQVTITRQGKSVTRNYEVVRSEENTRAISINMGLAKHRRVTIVQEGARLVLIDSHRRIVLKKL